MQANSFLSINQFGFLKGRNTTSQLLLCLYEWLSAKESHEKVDCVYIDFSKAFDVVNHRFLLHKLKNYGVSELLLNWIRSYLSSRTFQVKYQNTLSSMYSCFSGVPQGSILGPLLFVIYINEIEECSLGNSSIVMYADDVKISRVMSKSNPYSAWLEFKAELDNISQWAEKWKMTISESKCQHLSIISKVKNDFILRLNGTRIPQVTTVVRDLGILFSPDLSFSAHIKKIIVSASSCSNRILRSFVNHSIDLYRKAFITYCRPLLEYSTIIWSPHLKSEIDSIEKVQRRFTKRVLRRIDKNLYDSYSYAQRLQVFGLTSLHHRRIMTDLIECFKIVRGFQTHPLISGMFQVNCRPQRNGNSLTLIQDSVSSSQSLFFFKHRVTRLWNLLPDSIVSSSTVDAFKSRIEKEDLLELYEISNRNVHL